MKPIRFKYEKIATAALFFVILLKAWEVSNGPEFYAYDQTQINTVILTVTGGTTLAVYAAYRVVCSLADIARGRWTSWTGKNS